MLPWESAPAPVLSVNSDPSGCRCLKWESSGLGGGVVCLFCFFPRMFFQEIQELLIWVQVSLDSEGKPDFQRKKNKSFQSRPCWISKCQVQINRNRKEL